jgi:hypothetical protein
LKCDEVTVPAGIEARNVNFTKFTNAAGNMVLVNTRSKVSGIIVGSGITSAVQRGVYPAANGVTDVELDLNVSNLTFGVQGQPPSALLADAPQRWFGKLHFENIVGTVGASEGYGLLLSPGVSCKFRVTAKNIARHAVYLSAGARYNEIDADVDGCGNFAVQMYSLSTQPPTQYNSLKIRARNLTESVAGQSGAIAIVLNSHYNTVVVAAEGSTTTSQAVWLEGTNVAGQNPTGNKIINGSITGQFIGLDVIRETNCQDTIISGNTINAYATFSVIAFRNITTNPCTHGSHVFDNTINAQGQAIRGIYDECLVPNYVGPNWITNNGAGLRVDAATSGANRYGASRKFAFSGTTASIPNATTGDTTTTIPGSLATTGRNFSLFFTGSSGTLSGISVVAIYNNPTETSFTWRAFNNSGGAQTISYAGTVEGD